MSGGRGTARARSAEGHAVWLHPLAVALLPLPGMVAVLAADGVAVGLLATAVGVLAAGRRGWRTALGTLLMSAAAATLLWVGFSISLPDTAGDTAALRGALRIVGVMALFVGTGACVRWRVAGDSLVEYGHVPYRLVDVVSLGERFAVLMRADIRQARVLARLRARGRRWRSWRLLAGLTIPVLMAAFRHADELAIAMEARGFGSREHRTVHAAAPLHWRDGLTVAAVWAATITAAVWLAG